jgi:superfamily II DNA/RNA helicase
VVNYDLPWNPMKVEQRIGRIDRIGQKHDVIRVINLAYKETVEADVYFRLGERINLFQGIVGKLQPILARLPSKFEQLALERSENRDAARQRFRFIFGRAGQHVDCRHPAGGNPRDGRGRITCLKGIQRLRLPRNAGILPDAIDDLLSRQRAVLSQQRWSRQRRRACQVCEASSRDLHDANNHIFDGRARQKVDPACR